MEWDLNELAKEYIDKVTSGDLVSGRLARLAVDRHNKMLADADELGYYFDEKETAYIGQIFTILKHTSGDYGGKPFGMLPWQAFVLYYILAGRYGLLVSDWLGKHMLK